MHRVILMLSKPRGCRLPMESRQQVATSHAAWLWRIPSLLTCAVLIACGVAQVPAPDQLTENSAHLWRWSVDQGAASIQNSTARVRVGRASLQIDTSCPFRTAVFTAPSGGGWNLSVVSGMAFWVYAENPNPAGFQGHSPWIRLYTTDRDYFEIRANRNVVEIRPDVRAREGRQPPISDFRAYTRRGSVSRKTSVTITFRGENGEVFRRLIRVRP